MKLPLFSLYSQANLYTNFTQNWTFSINDEKNGVKYIYFFFTFVGDISRNVSFNYLWNSNHKQNK